MTHGTSGPRLVDGTDRFQVTDFLELVSVELWPKGVRIIALAQSDDGRWSLGDVAVPGTRNVDVSMGVQQETLGDGYRIEWVVESHDSAIGEIILCGVTLQLH